MNDDWAELVKIPSRVIDNASSREAPRDLDKNSFESQRLLVEIYYWWKAETAVGSREKPLKLKLFHI